MPEVGFQRKPVMAGNWKMFKTSAETRQFFKVFNTLVARIDHCEIVIATPFVSLAVAVAETAGSPVRIAAQNVHWEAQGAFTGEISGPMVRAVGCNYVIVGHSERRRYFGETDETVRKRTAAALEYGLAPIVCVGERLEERETGMTEDVLTQQFTGALGSLTVEQFSRIIVAYEPVWAIGTGRTATPAIAAKAHEVLRIQAAKQFGEDSAAGLRILYGGSVKPDNVSDLMAESGVDGALVGGASLDPQSMALIVNYSGESF